MRLPGRGCSIFSRRGLVMSLRLGQNGLMTLPASSPDIRICAVAEVSRHLGWATHTISILQRKIQHERPDWKAAGIPALEQTFDDIQHVDTLRMKQRKGEPPEERHILEIIRFARRLPPGARLLVHCERASAARLPPPSLCCLPSNPTLNPPR